MSVELEEAVTSEDALARPEAHMPDTTRRRRRKFGHVPAALWVAIILLAAITADWLPLADPEADAGHGVRTPPFQVAAEFLGTDGAGRSQLSRIIYGARVSLFAASAATLIALCVGLLVGVTSGYFRGRVDAALGLVVDSLLAFPGLILLMALSAAMSPGLQTVVVGLSIFGSLSFARLARSNTLRIGGSEYVIASKGLGARHRTTMFREILPNVLSATITYAGVVIGTLMLAEATLSFLGLGVNPPTPSWGNMIASGRIDIADHPYLIFVPAIFLFLTVFSMNVLGDWARSRSDASSKL